MASRAGMIGSFYEGRVWKEQQESVLLPLLEGRDTILVDDPQGRLTW